MSEVTGRANMLPDAVLDGAVVDSSAIMGVFENRPSAMAFKEAFKRCRRLHMSAGTLAALSIPFNGNQRFLPRRCHRPSIRSKPAIEH